MPRASTVIVGSASPSRAENAFKRFPSWMWRNREVDGFVRWLREHNAALTAEQRVEFRGRRLQPRQLDARSAGLSGSHRLAAAAAARRRYGCLSPWQEDPADYGRNVMLGQPSCENAVIEQLQALLTQRLAYIDQTASASSMPNATRGGACRGALLSGDVPRLDGVPESARPAHVRYAACPTHHRGADAKAVVWAHNSHIGNAAATSMGWGEFNIGELLPHGLRPRRGADRHGDRPRRGRRGGQLGRADAAQAGHPVAAGQLGAAAPAGVPASLTDWRDDRGKLREALSHPRLERAIGVIYRPLTERQSHYFAPSSPSSSTR